MTLMHPCRLTAIPDTCLFLSRDCANDNVLSCVTILLQYFNVVFELLVVACVLLLPVSARMMLCYKHVIISYGPVCVTSRYCFESGGRIKVVCWHGGFFPPMLYCVIRKFRYLQIGYFSLELYLDSGLRRKLPLP